MVDKIGAASDGRLALSVNEFSALFGISRSSAWNAVWAGQVRSLIIGRRTLIPRSEIARLLQGEAVPPPGKP